MIKRKEGEIWEEYVERRRENKQKEEEKTNKKLAGKWLYNFPPRPILDSLKAQDITAEQLKERQDYNRKRKGFRPGEGAKEEE